MSDTYLLSGISAIVNADNARKDVSVKDVEDSMRNTSDNTADKLTEEMNDIARRLGISFDEPADNGAVSAPTEVPPADNGADFLAPVDVPPAFGFDAGDGGDDVGRTDEQYRHNIINNVIPGGGCSFETEKREDEKMNMLAEIDSLKESLIEDGADISRIAEVNRDSGYEQIKEVLHILRYKNDYLRYNTFAEEFVLFGVHSLEDLFDGKRSWMGYTPDLTGFHRQVGVKLRRMRHDTSQVVSDVMHGYNIGPMTRIFLELFPSLILYSRMRKHHEGDRTYSEQDMAMASSRIRDL